MCVSAHQPWLPETLHTAETAGIQLKEALLVGVVGNSFDDGTELACPKHWNWWWSSYGGMA